MHVTDPWRWWWSCTVPPFTMPFALWQQGALPYSFDVDDSTLPSAAAVLGKSSCHLLGRELLLSAGLLSSPAVHAGQPSAWGFPVGPVTVPTSGHTTT